MTTQLHDNLGRRAAVTPGAFGIGWTLLFVAVLLAVLGVIFNWYERFAFFDEAIHAFSFFALSLLIGLCLYGDALTGRVNHAAALVFVVTCVGLALGVAWEWAEWAYDHWSGPKNLIHGKTDTLADLAMDGIGALAAGLVMLWLVRRRRGGSAGTAAQDA